MNDPPASRRRDTGRLIVVSIVVLATALLLRLPACHESFWIDELHTAWTVWDGAGAVWQRARLGNQTPFYFWGVWGWKQLFGGSEWSLRMPSVLASSLASVVLCAGLGAVFRSVAAGLSAGLILAVERNSLFFSTELRPYAFVILGSAVAVVCFAALLARPSRRTGSVAWGGLVAACLFSALLQPTSLGVLILLPIVLLLRWRLVDLRHRGWLTRREGMLLLLVVVAAAVLWPVALGSVWQRREQWADFASAESAAQIVTIWDWRPLLLLPLGAALLGKKGVRTLFQRQKRVLTPFFLIAVLLAFICVGATLGYWSIARWGGVPIWHRRYLIALLPVFAGLSGASVASLGSFRTFEIFQRRHAWHGVAVVIVAGLFPAVLAWQQGTFEVVQQPGGRLIQRGENWRAAAAWLRPRLEPADRVYLMSGLIEAPRYLEAGWRPKADATPCELGYLCLPLLGPYNLPPSTPLWPILDDRSFATELLATPGPNPSQVFIVARLPASTLREWFDVTEETLDPRLSLEEADIRGFGTVSVARFPVAEQKKRGQDSF